MSHGLTQLHSHSGLERDLKFPKHTVLIDAAFGAQVHKHGFKTVLFLSHGHEYLKVNILDFVNSGGVFKNLSE